MRPQLKVDKDLFDLEKSLQEKQVNVYMDKVKLIKDVSQLMDQKLEGIDIVKCVNGECPWNNKYSTIDFKLDVFGTQEDQFYARVPELIQNVRRGNTILQIKDQNGNSDYHMGRKGLMKFFDMRLNFISKEERSTPEKLDDLNVEKNYILSPVLKAI